MKRDRVADTPEDGPASEADFEILPEVEVCLLTVVPGARRIVMSGQLSQHDVEAVGSYRREERERVGAGGYKGDVVGWLCIAGEGERPHGRGSPIQLLLAKGERVAREGDSSVQFDCAHVIERCFCSYRPYHGIRIWLRSIDYVDQLVDGRLCFW